MSEFVLLPHQYCKYKNSEFELLLQNYIEPLYHMRVVKLNFFLKKH